MKNKPKRDEGRQQSTVSGMRHACYFHGNKLKAYLAYRMTCVGQPMGKSSVLSVTDQFSDREEAEELVGPGGKSDPGT